MNPLWSTLNEPNFKVTYRDADRPSWQSYGSGGELIDTDDTILIQPSQWQVPFVKWFGIVFTPIFIVVGLIFIPTPHKWLFLFLAPVAGISTFVLIYKLVQRDVDAGPYIRVDLREKTIHLPRQNIAFATSEINHFQIITGTDKFDRDRQTDLNVVVGNENHIRYFVMGSPNRKFVDLISQRSMIPVFETKLGRRGRRDIDFTHNDDA